MIPPAWFVILAAVLFVLGVAAFFIKRDLIGQFMAVEIMLNAGNLAFLGLAKAQGFLDAQAAVFFVVAVAAAEAAIGLAIVLHVFRRRKSVDSDSLRAMRG